MRTDWDPVDPVCVHVRTHAPARVVNFTDLASSARDPGVLCCLVYTGSHSNSEVTQAGLSEI